jgi:hypothetical protein
MLTLQKYSAKNCFRYFDVYKNVDPHNISHFSDKHYLWLQAAVNIAVSCDGTQSALVKVKQSH